MISTELFPYQNHPYRLEFGDKKNLTLCFFECKEHLDKYIERYKLKAKDIQVQYRDEQPIKSSKANKTKVRQGTGKSSDGSTSRGKRSTKNLDISGTSNRSRKSKK
jgi:hypothetical protein